MDNAASPEERADKLGLKVLQNSEATRDFINLDGASPYPILRELPPAAVYPVDALPPVMRDAVTGIQDLTQAATALCGQSVMATAALAAQTFNDVALPTGQERPLSLFMVTIAESGDRKSAADEYAMRAVKRREAELRERFELEKADHENAVAVREERRKAAFKAFKDDGVGLNDELANIGPEPRQPLYPILISEEPTFEALCGTLLNGQPSEGVFTNEGGQFIAGHALNRDNRIKTAAGLSNFWDGSPVKRVRVGSGNSILAGRRVSMHLMCQPGVAVGLLGDSGLKDQGLLSRMLVAAPDSPAGTRLWRDPAIDSDNAVAAFGRVVRGMLEKPFPLKEDTANELSPHVLTLSGEARRRAIVFYNEIERRLSKDLAAIKGLAGKGLELACRLAGVMATLDRQLTDGGEISADDMDRGIEIFRFHLAEASRLFDLRQVDDEAMASKRLLEWLQGRKAEFGPRFSATEIIQFGPSGYRVKKTADEGIKFLMDHGYLEPAGRGPVKVRKGGETVEEIRKETFLLK